MKRYKIAILVGHPIQYFSPLFREITSDPRFDLTVYYCSDEGAREVYTPDFNAVVQWDIPLFEGYRYKILRNHAFNPSIFSGYFGLMNFGIIKEIRSGRYDALIVHGWNYFTFLIAIVFANVYGVKIFMRGDNPKNQELIKSRYKIFIKRMLLQSALFRLIDGFLYVGSENRDFYKFYHVASNKLFFVPHVVDNERFIRAYDRLVKDKKQIKQELGIHPDKTVILCTGKLIDKKRPMDLLKAYEKIGDENKVLVYVGDGPLRDEIEAYVEEKKLPDVYIMGFINQTELPKYYVLADVLVLPSGSETWGLVVNEAMCFHLPIIISDTAGCGRDLVRHGKNGYIFKTGDIDDLSACLSLLLRGPEVKKEMGHQSFEIIKEWDYKADIKGLLSAISIVHERAPDVVSQDGSRS